MSAPPCGETGGNGFRRSLPDSARNALAELVRLIEARFSGRIVLEVSQGGVRVLEVTERLDGRALEQRRQRAQG